MGVGHRRRTVGSAGQTATGAEPTRLAFPRAEAVLDRVLGGNAVVQVVLLYAITRLFTTVALALVAPSQLPADMTDNEAVGYIGFTRLWDGQWYERVATDGYPDTVPRDPAGIAMQNTWAFYPLFPFLSRAVMEATGLSFAAAASSLALVLGFGAAVAMAALLRPRIGRTGSLLVVGLYAVFPSSPALQVAYTESLAMLLLCGYLLALTRERWLVATGLALLIGVTRPIALPLGVVTLVALWRRWRRRATEPMSSGEIGAALTSLVGCGVAGLLWPGIAWIATGQMSAYVDTMGAWSLTGHVQILEPWFSIPRYYLGDWGPRLFALTLVLLLVGMAGPWARRLGPELRVWPLIYAAYVIAVQTPGTSTARYLLPMFPYLAVLLGVAGARGRGRGIPTTARALVLAAAFVWLQWKWISVVWLFTPPIDFAP
jgi:hypothetical protein